MNSKKLPKHLCETCKQEYPCCESGEVVYASSINPELKGKEADVVLQCEGYKSKEPDEHHG